LSFPPVKEQLDVLLRGAVDVITRPELEERLEASRASGVPLKVKAGFDPTRPDLHIGHAVLLKKMKDFQDLGHEVILVVGGFTAMLGDPSGQNELRPRLSAEEVAAAAETYTTQAFAILDRERTRVTNNADWLAPLRAADLVHLMAQKTVARMLERKDFAQRFEAETDIYQHEFLYPLLQGYDSVELECDVELGGTDQLFNLLVGRDIMPRYRSKKGEGHQRGQMVMTVPLLEGIDARMVDGRVTGKKMSKSYGNYIGLQEDPLTMHRKVMQVDDAIIFRYFELLSTRSSAAIAELVGKDPREVKALFADELITTLHSADAAKRAAAEFQRIYSDDAIPDDVPSHTVKTETETLWIAKALSSVGLVKSTGEGKRLVEQGGVEVDRVRVTDPQLQLEPGKRYLVRVGSKNRKFAYITVSR
jgi:tyrosyl-tRNA synthetase